MLSPRSISLLCSQNIQVFAEPLSGICWIQDLIDEASLGSYEGIGKSKESVERREEEKKLECNYVLIRERRGIRIDK